MEHSVKLLTDRSERWNSSIVEIYRLPTSSGADDRETRLCSRLAPGERAMSTPQPPLVTAAHPTNRLLAALAPAGIALLESPLKVVNLDLCEERWR
jgi:hypothetical protein